MEIIIKKETTNKGITIMALVVTIVVLLILAVVTITNLTGNNGIVKKAETASKKTELAELEEQVEMAIIRTEQKHRNPNIYDIIEELKNEKIIRKEEQVDLETGKIETDLGYIIEGKLDDYVIKEAIPGKIVIGERNKEYTKNGKAIIPVSFMIVPGLDDVSEGLVISDDAEDTELDSNNKVAKGNQFVWIPVTDAKTYQRNRNYQDINASKIAYTDKDYLPDTIQPDISQVIETEEKTADQIIGEMNEEAEREQVISKGGFYIARYEAGKEETNILVSKKEANIWNNTTPENAKATAKTMFTENTHVKSALISGIQWDIVMEFITREPARKDGLGDDYIVTSSKDNRHIRAEWPQKAGYNEADRVCNIYDLEGNGREYIAEVGSPAIHRGGGFNYKSSASFRSGSIGAPFKDNTFRVVLYVI